MHPNFGNQRLIKRVISTGILHPHFQDIVDVTRQPVRLLHFGTVAQGLQKGRLPAGFMIYTPQMIVNGQDDVVGARAMELADLIDAHRSTAAVIRLQASRNGERISIRAQALQPVQEPLTIFLIRFTPQHRTEIKRGENAGQVLNYANVVDDWRILGQWDGKAVFETSTTVEGPRPAVVLVQKPGPGAIVAAELVK